MTENYDDIISLPHHVSCRRQRMPMEERAAQFAPFSALNGYHSAIEKSANQIKERIETGIYEFT